MEEEERETERREGRQAKNPPMSGGMADWQLESLECKEKQGHGRGGNLENLAQPEPIFLPESTDLLKGLLADKGLHL